MGGSAAPGPGCAGREQRWRQPRSPSQWPGATAAPARPNLAKNRGQQGSGSPLEGQGEWGPSNTFIRKKVMLVSKSTVDLRSCSLSGLLAGKLFCQRGRNKQSCTQKSHRDKWRGRKQPPVVSDRTRQVGKLRRSSNLTRYMDRSIRSELCSWSRSLTNRSFCGEMPQSQVNGGEAAGTTPLPTAPALSAHSLAHTLHPAHPSPSHCPSFPPSSISALWAGMGCLRRRARPRCWLGLSGSHQQLPGHRSHAGHGTGTRGNTVYSLAVSASVGMGCSVCPVHLNRARTQGRSRERV